MCEEERLAAAGEYAEPRDIFAAAEEALAPRLPPKVVANGSSSWKLRSWAGVFHSLRQLLALLMFLFDSQLSEAELDARLRKSCSHRDQATNDDEWLEAAKEEIKWGMLRTKAGVCVTSNLDIPWHTAPLLCCNAPVKLFMICLLPPRVRST